LFDFDSINGSFPQSQQLLLYNNKLYGTSAYGGIDNKGLIFEFDPATAIFTKK